MGAGEDPYRRFEREKSESERRTASELQYLIVCIQYTSTLYLTIISSTLFNTKK